MKRSLMFLAAIGAVAVSFSQTPSQFKYQAVLRDPSGNLIVTQSIAVVINILQGGPSGTIVFTETHNVTTSDQGVINLNIGSINPSGLTGINWSSNTYYIKVKVGGVDMGTSQILSVPYALNAKSAETADFNKLTNVPAIFNTSWTSVFGKPTFATVATSGNYNDLLFRPSLFDGAWTSISGKPTTLSGYGITNPVNTTILNAVCTSIPSVSTSFVKLSDIGSFTKLNSSSPVEITFNGRIGVGGTIGGNGVFFEIRVDGNASTAGTVRGIVKKGEAGGIDGVHVTIIGMFNGLSSGSHTVSMWVLSQGSTSTTIYLDPGCWGSDVVIIKEFR